MIGSLIGGHIRILSALGQGGMGEVYAGHDETLDRPVAVKAIRADRQFSADARERFIREARALSALDHPNICRIYEYVETPEDAFLILELIDGVTLNRAIDRGMSRQRKLQIAENVLQALVAAHRKGIVHRDLKPDNVMITTDGGVKVLDFGIAQLESAERRESAAENVISADGGTTVIFPIDSTVAARPRGAFAIGTPLYMSPEQASGGDVTSASDLYSFGLLLQALLTEERPQPEGLSSADLVLRASLGKSSDMRGERRDVSALVAALKSYAPAVRPTAAEALASVRRILDAPHRRIRYATAIVALLLMLGAAARYAYDVTAARDEARRGRRNAEQLINFMVGDLRRNLEAVGRLDILDGVASRALAYFASLRPDELTGDDLNHHARALAQLGEVRDQEGKLPQAIELFEQSVRFAAAAVERDETREEWQLSLSNAYFQLGDAFRRQGNTRETLRNFEAYFRIAQQLAQRHPDQLQYQAEVSYGHGNLGAAHEAAGDVSRSLAEYRIAIDLDRERLRRQPANEQWQADLANSLNRLGVILKGRGEFAVARRAFDEDLQIRRRLAQAAPDDARRQQRLATSLAYAGVLQEATGDDAQALASFREEAALQTTLAQRDPANADTRRNRAVAHSRVASMLPPQEGLAMAEAAVRQLRALTAADARVVWKRDLAVALVRLGTLHMRRREVAAVRAICAEALPSAERLFASQPTNAQSIRIAAEALLLQAWTDEQDGRLSLAAQRRERAATIAAAAAGDSTVDPVRVRALIALGRSADAAPIVQRLLAGGYRETELIALTANLHPPPPIATR